MNELQGTMIRHGGCRRDDKILPNINAVIWTFRKRFFRSKSVANREDSQISGISIQLHKTIVRLVIT
jgi:hypothetical protein